jgi:multiple sugar transport system permease protein
VIEPANEGRAVAASAVARPRRAGLLRREQVDAYLCLAPWAIGQVVFVLGPMIFSLALTFMDWSLLSAPTFVGLANFERMVDDDLFYVSLYNTAYYTLLAVPLHLLIALVVALAVNLPLRGINAIRTIYYMPSITPQVASIILWLWIFNPEFGLANALIRAVGGKDQLWFADPDLAKLTFVIISLWGFGEAMIIFLAGLQGIPETLYEAARIDGAGTMALFWRITLPLLTPVIFFNLVIGIIGSFQVFTAVFIATNRAEGGLGGPANSTLFLVLYLYKQGFSYFRMGYASLLAWVLFVVILAFTLLQFWLSRRWVYYEGGGR